MTLLLLLFGEIMPKRVAVLWSAQTAVLYTPVLEVAITLFAPPRRLLNIVSMWFARHLTPRGKPLTEDEFLSVVSMSEEAGVLDEEERTMVDGIVRLEDIQASDVMTPRVDLIGVALDDDREDIVRKARGSKVHYLPVYRDTIDHVEGFLDVLKFLLSPGADLQAATIPAFHVPETAPLDRLLAAFQRERRRVAIVADEYGGTAGLITLGDILEEIADDVEDEYGEEKLTIEALGPDRWLADGATSLEDINYELDLELEAEGADRIAGWVSAIVGHIPRPGETVEAQGCRVTAQRVRRARVTLVLIEKLPPPPGAEEEEP
jgi:putative hemolysin